MEHFPQRENVPQIGVFHTPCLWNKGQGSIIAGPVPHRVLEAWTDGPAMLAGKWGFLAMAIANGRVVETIQCVEGRNVKGR